MKNKIKPFYIRITDDMTPQVVQDAFDKCVDAGAVAQDGIKNTNMKRKYNDLYSLSFEYVGVDYENNTYTTIDTDAYGDVAQEITLDQLDEWLGLEVEQEWKNGDSCIFGSSDMSGVYIAYDKYNSGHVIYSCGEYFYVSDGDFHKPETPEQKAERERLEAAYDLYCTGNKGLNVTAPCTFDDFMSDEIQVKFWLSIVNKTNYRKGE